MISETLSNPWQSLTLAVEDNSLRLTSSKVKQRFTVASNGRTTDKICSFLTLNDL